MVFTLPPIPLVIAKVFRQADAEESGSVDPNLVPSLAMKVLGNDIKESEKRMIQYKAETKTGKWWLWLEDTPYMLKCGCGFELANKNSLAPL